MARKVLIACEESGAVTAAMVARGVDAWSCDLQETSGSLPHRHIRGDVLDALQYGNWDAVIAFPPCTHLASSGARWFAEKRADGRQGEAIAFFREFIGCAPMVAIENPIGIMSRVWRKPDQIIQPWQFGHGETKATCLWLQGLPKLVPTQIVGGRRGRILEYSPSPDRGKLRSKTYTGIAAAMAAQWASYLI